MDLDIDGVVFTSNSERGQTMSKKRFFTLFLGLVFVFGMARWQPTSAQNPQVYPALAAKVAEQGYVNLIVGLKLPKEFTPEGYLDAKAAAQQRAAIRAAQQSLLNSLGSGAQAYALYEFIPFMALRVNTVAWELLTLSPLVTSIAEDRPIPLALESSVPVSGVPTVWNEGIEGSGWAVAVLDTGVQWHHEFFGGTEHSRVVSEACYSNAGDEGTTLCPNGQKTQETGHAADPNIAACSSDGSNPDGGSLCRHGTHVAGIAAGSHAYASVSYDGVARAASIIGIQVFTRFSASQCGGSSPCVMSYSSDQISGLQRVYALRNTYNIAAVNMSLGGGGYTESQQGQCDTDNAATKAAIDTLRSVGIATIIAAGNNGYVDKISAPACISTAIAVGASTDFDTIASFSNMNSLVELMAPGVAIVSSVSSPNTPGNTYMSMQGTSMATPYAAGVWTLLRSMKPAASIDDILAALQNTGPLIVDTRTGGSTSKPRVQADRAAMALNPVTWVGSTGAWNEGANWSSNAVPSRLSTVTIPTSPSGGNYPVLNANASVGHLTIENGAYITVTSPYTLTVAGNWTSVGTGTFYAITGTVHFVGNYDHSLTMSGTSDDHFYNLTIGDGSDATVLTPASNVKINGDLTIAQNAKLNGGTHTFYVGGNWVDAGTSFVHGTSTVVFQGSGKTLTRHELAPLLLTQTFSEYDGMSDNSFTTAPPAKWTEQNNGGTNNDWYYGRFASLELDKAFAIRWYGSSGSADAWLFSPALSLEPYKPYTLTFAYRVVNSSYAQNLDVKLGNSPTSTAMTQTLYTATNINTTTWLTLTQSFTVGGKSTYHIGFRNYRTPAGSYGLMLDNITLKSQDKLEFYNLVVSGSVTAAKPLWVKNDLTVSPGGVLDLGTQTLTVDNTLTNTGTLRQTRSVNNATVEFLHVRNAADNADKYHGVDITTTGNMGNVTVTIRGNQTSGCTTNPYDPLLKRCFAITPDTTQSATVKFWYTEAERNNQVANAMKLWHYSGPPANWTQVGTGYTYSEDGTSCTSGGGQACWMQATGVNTYSPFGVGSGDKPTALVLFKMRAHSTAVLPFGALALGLLVLFWRRKR